MSERWIKSDIDPKKWLRERLREGKYDNGPYVDKDEMKSDLLQNFDMSENYADHVVRRLLLEE